MKIHKKLVQPLTPDETEELDKTMSKNLPMAQNNIFTFRSISENELDKQVRKIEIHKNSGVKDIST